MLPPPLRSGGIPPFAATAAALPTRVAFIDAPSGRTTTWATLDTSVEAMAAGLRRHGLEPGDRVALLLGNRLEFVASYFAALRAGMVVLPLAVIAAT